jgi:hypothetical protein
MPLQLQLFVANHLHHPLKLPILIRRFNSPLEFLSEGLGEEAFNGDIIFLGENDREAGVDVILRREKISTPPTMSRTHEEKLKGRKG